MLRGASNPVTAVLGEITSQFPTRIYRDSTGTASCAGNAVYHAPRTCTIGHRPRLAPWCPQALAPTERVNLTRLARTGPLRRPAKALSIVFPGPQASLRLAPFLRSLPESEEPKDDQDDHDGTDDVDDLMHEIHLSMDGSSDGTREPGD